MTVPLPAPIDVRGPIRPMRIATGIHSLQLGGSQVNTIDLSACLRDRGHDVRLFAIEEEPRVSVLPVAERAGLEITILPSVSSLSAQARVIRDFTDAMDAQILHVYHEDHWLGPLGAIALRDRPDRSLVVTNWMMSNNRWMPLHASLVLGVEALCEEARTYHRGPVWLLEPVVDVRRDAPDPSAAAAFRGERGFGSEELLVVLVTRVDRRMKLDAIRRTIAAVTAIDRPDARLVVVGDGDAFETVRELATEANRALGREAVVLTGVLHDPRPAYAAADVVVGMGGSALRGLAFGKPLVVAGEEGFSEIFAPDTAHHFLRFGYHGVGPADPDGIRLAEQLRSLFDEARRAELAAFGMAVVHERYSVDVLTDRLEQIYAGALARPTSRAKRWADDVYVRSYARAHSLLPAGVRESVRRLGGAARRINSTSNVET